MEASGYMLPTVESAPAVDEFVVVEPIGDAATAAVGETAVVAPVGELSVVPPNPAANAELL
jgi:hypothetical protein